MIEKKFKLVCHISWHDWIAGTTPGFQKIPLIIHKNQLFTRKLKKKRRGSWWLDFQLPTPTFSGISCFNGKLNKTGILKFTCS
jgi:hypothetical protein